MAQIFSSIETLQTLWFDPKLWGDDDFWLSIAIHAQDFLETSWTEGLFPDTYRRFREVNGPHQEFEERLAHVETARSQARTVLPALAPFTVLLKGLGIEHYYPTTRTRYSSDVDVVVATLDDFWKVADILHGLSYRQRTTILIRKRTDTKELVGVAFFDQIEPLPNRMGSIEVQIGIFPITYCTAIPMSTLLHDLMKLPEEWGGISIPSTERQLLVMLAEFETRTRLKVRDLYDWLRVSGSTQDLDVHKIITLAASFGVNHGLAILRDALNSAKVGLLSERAREFMSDITVHKARRSTLPMVTSCAPSQIWHHVTHVEKSHLPFLRVALQMFRGSTMRWNVKDKFLPFLRFMDFKGTPKLWFDISMLTYFVLIDRKVSEWRWRHTNGMWLVESPIGTFVPSTNAVLTDSDIQRSRSAASCYSQEN